MCECVGMCVRMYAYVCEHVCTCVLLHVCVCAYVCVSQGTVKGGRRQGGQKKRWEDNIREWTCLEFANPEGSGEQGKMEKTGCKINCVAPTTLAVKGLMMMYVSYLLMRT